MKTPINNKLWQIALVFLTISIFAIVFGDAKASPESSHNKPLNYVQELKALMPKDFNEVHLGMSKELLLKVRSVKPIRVDKGESPKIWLEKGLKSPFYDTVMYGFSETSDELEWVVFFIESSGMYIRKYTPYLLKGSIIKWGDDYRIVINQMRHSRRSYPGATLVWQKEIATIAVTYTPKHSAVEEEPSTFQVRIMAPKLEHDKVIRIVKDAPEADYAYIRSDLEDSNDINSTDIPYFE